MSGRKSSRCYQCRRKSKHLLTCWKCKQATYCSKKCQQNHWHLHKKACFTAEETNSAVEDIPKNSEFEKSFDEMMAFARKFDHVATICRSCRTNPNPACRFVTVLKIDWTARFTNDNTVLVCCCIARACIQIQHGNGTFKFSCALMPIDVRCCAGCHETITKAKKCGTCRQAWYCSEECQREHWARHRLTCKRSC